MNLNKYMLNTYIVEEVRIAPGEEQTVRVKARKQGLFAWLGARLFKTFTGLEFEVHSDRMVCTEVVKHIIPMKKVSDFVVGRFINPLWIVLAALSLLFAIYYQFNNRGTGFGVVLLVLAVLFIILYIASNRMMVRVTSSGGDGFAFCLKSSAIGGDKFGDEEAAQIADIVIKQIAAV